MPHHLQAGVRLRLGGQPPKIPPNATLVFEVSGRATEGQAESCLISAQGLAALQPFLLPGDNVAKAEGPLPWGGKTWSAPFLLLLLPENCQWAGFSWGEVAASPSFRLEAAG